MSEYKLVSLPTKGFRSLNRTFADNIEAASAELNSAWVAAGWDVVNALQSPVIGQVAFLLHRD